MNQIQDAINQIINGTYSLKSLTVDGTGGVVVSQAPGQITSTGAIHAGGAITTTGEFFGEYLVFPNDFLSYPTPGTDIANSIRNLNTCKAWGTISWNGTSNVIQNDSAGCIITWSTGMYPIVTFNKNMASTTYAVIVSYGTSDGLPTGTNVGQVRSYGQAVSQFGIYFDAVGDPTDATISFAVFGRQT